MSTFDPAAEKVKTNYAQGVAAAGGATPRDTAVALHPSAGLFHSPDQRTEVGAQHQRGFFQTIRGAAARFTDAIANGAQFLGSNRLPASVPVPVVDKTVDRPGPTLP